MALSEKHRSSIYRTLSPMLGEEEAEALLSQFPARDLEHGVGSGDRGCVALTGQSSCLCSRRIRSTR